MRKFLTLEEKNIKNRKLESIFFSCLMEFLNMLNISITVFKIEAIHQKQIIIYANNKDALLKLLKNHRDLFSKIVKKHVSLKFFPRIMTREYSE